MVVQVVFGADGPLLPFRGRIHGFSQRWAGHQALPAQLFTASDVPLKRLDLSHNGFVLVPLPSFCFSFLACKKNKNKTKQKKDSEGFTTHQLGKPVPVCVCVCSMTSRAGRTWKWLDLSHTLRRDRGIVFGVSSICDVETGRLFIFHSLLRPIRGARSTSQALHRRLAAVKKKHKCGLIGK